jgi:hypothetical protein
MADRTDTTYRNTSARIGHLAQLKLGNQASPEVFQAVANVKSIQPGAMTAEVVDVTHLRSPEFHREKIAGMRDTGPFSCVISWDPTDESHSNAGGGSGSFTGGGLAALARSRAERNWMIEFDVLQFGSPALQWPFAGVVTNFTPGPIESPTELTATLEITPLRDVTAALP